MKSGRAKKGRLFQYAWQIDLHGFSVEDGLEAMVRFLDQAMLARATEALVIHGHGQNKLKKAIRDALAISPYVKSCRPGSVWEGGDGATVVTLQDDDQALEPPDKFGRKASQNH